MRFPALFCLLALGLFSRAQENNLKLTVVFPQDIDDSVFLKINKATYPVFASGNRVDFDLTVHEASKASISLRKSKCLFFFYADPGVMEITADYFETDGQPCISKKNIKGGKTQEDLDRFDKARQKIKKKYIEKAARANIAKLSFDMIEKYRHSQVSMDVIRTVHKELGKEWTASALDKVDDSLSSPVRDSYTKSFLSGELLQKGNYIDFTQNDIDGSSFTLSSLKGKYVLLDFWASWCIPCRRENPKLKSLYEKYKDRGFEIVGVSLDSKEESWKQAVEKDALPWIHISDLKGWANEISSTLGIQGIPSTILIDPDGKIIDFNLRGNELERAVAKAVNNND